MFVCSTYWKTEYEAGGGVAGLAGDADAHPYAPSQSISYDQC